MTCRQRGPPSANHLPSLSSWRTSADANAIRACESEGMTRHHVVGRGSRGAAQMMCFASRLWESTNLETCLVAELTSVKSA